MLKILFSILIFKLFFLPSIADAWGFRPMAMGGAFTAIADDANCAYWNTAGAAQLDDFKIGESQIITTNRFYDEIGILNRKAKDDITFFDSVNFVRKINKNFGVGFAGSYNGSDAFDFIPSIAYRLPWNSKMSIGLSFFYIKRKYLYLSETTLTNLVTKEIFKEILDARKTISKQGVNLDYLWKINSDWSFGAKIDGFLQTSDFRNVIESWPDKDFTNIALNDNKIRLMDKFYLNAGIAWHPKNILNGAIIDFTVDNVLNMKEELLVVNELFNAKGDKLNTSKEKTVFSIGIEYNFSRLNKKGAIKFPQNIIRCGLNNNAITIGYENKINNKYGIGYYGQLSFKGEHNHNIGFSLRI